MPYFLLSYYVAEWNHFNTQNVILKKYHSYIKDSWSKEIRVSILRIYTLNINMNIKFDYTRKKIVHT